MPKSVHITTPHATLDEVARSLRIPKRRQKELRVMAEEYVTRLNAEKETGVGKVIERNEKRKNASAAD